MAYQSSTLGATVANPPRLLVASMAGLNPASTVPFGPSIWMYQSTDSTTLVQGSNYFTDAQALGMRQNDIMFAQCQSSVGASQVLLIGSLSAVTTSGANLSTGGAVSSTFN